MLRIVCIANSILCNASTMSTTLKILGTAQCMLAGQLMRCWLGKLGLVNAE